MLCLHRWGASPPAIEIAPLGALVAVATSQARFYTLLLSVFAGIALVTAAAGIFGLCSFIVEQRRREIGIRVALGAGYAHALGMVLGQAGGLALAGLVVGTVVALWPGSLRRRSSASSQPPGRSRRCAAARRRVRHDARDAKGWSRRESNRHGTE